MVLCAAHQALPGLLSHCPPAPPGGVLVVLRLLPLHPHLVAAQRHLRNDHLRMRGVPLHEDGDEGHSAEHGGEGGPLKTV